ncbi:MAG: hypothetical protein M1820_006822 [Bogoriella megaspora]|nr:MAG: hypothetical protein M1820_006822 [Bogoriella megaspora]
MRTFRWIVAILYSILILGHAAPSESNENLKDTGLAVYAREYSQDDYSQVKKRMNANNPSEKVLRRTIHVIGPNAIGTASHGTAIGTHGLNGCAYVVIRGQVHNTIVSIIAHITATAIDHMVDQMDRGARSHGITPANGGVFIYTPGSTGANSPTRQARLQCSTDLVEAFRSRGWTVQDHRDYPRHNQMPHRYQGTALVDDDSSIWVCGFRVA